MQKVRANISLTAIRHNAEAFKTLTKTRLCAVVKANAYGHGAENVVYAISDIADCFAVALIDEAKAVRVAACGKDILVLTPPLCEEEIYDGAANGFILTVPDLWTAKRVIKTATCRHLPVRVHLKVNTGMNRYGMDVSVIGKVCTLFRACDLIKVEGVFSHLCRTERLYSIEQRSRFLDMQAICRAYYPQAMGHLSATYGALLGGDFALDMVRIGIGLYGYLPDGAKDLDENVCRSLDLHRAMKITATVAGNQNYAFGGAGYGVPVWERRGEKAPKRLSVCRIGYADGVLRRADNGICGWQNNANAMCMDARICTGEHKRGEEVCIMDDAAATARLTGTISYEVLCAATRRAEFIYDGK